MSPDASALSIIHPPVIGAPELVSICAVDHMNLYVTAATSAPVFSAILATSLTFGYPPAESTSFTAPVVTIGVVTFA